MNKRGRPFIDDPRVNRVEIRMSKKESDLLDDVSKEFGMSRPDTVRKLLEDYKKKGE